MWLNKIFHLFHLSSDEPSLISELWDYLVGKYFSVELGQYDYIQIGSGSLVTLQRVVLGLFGGIILAAGIVLYDKNVLGDFVRKIINDGCLSPDTAKTLEELGYERNGGVKASLKSPNKLGRVVHSVEKEQYEREVEEAKAAYVAEHGSDKDFFMPAYRMDVSRDHFYIPDEEHYRAEIRFENKGSGWIAFILVTVLSVIAAGAVCFLLPDVLQLVDNMIGMIAG